MSGPVKCGCAENQTSSSAMYNVSKCKCKCKCNLYFKSVYKLQETRATKALGRLDRRLTVPSEALESSKEINFLFLRIVCAEGKRANHLTNTTTMKDT